MLDPQLESALEQALMHAQQRAAQAATPAGPREPSRQLLLPYLPCLPADQLLPLLDAEANRAVRRAYDYGGDLVAAVLACLPDGLIKATLDGWQWPAGSTLALRPPVRLEWLLNLGRWLAAYDPLQPSEQITLHHLGLACLYARGLSPDSTWADQPLLSAGRLDPRQVDEFEKLLAADPDDPFLRSYLCCYYWQRDDRHGPQVLWHIEHCPESATLSSPPGRFDPQRDPAGYAQAGQLWAQSLRQQPLSVPVLSNAAAHFDGADRKLAFLLYAECARLDPENPQWQEFLGRMILRDAPTQHRGRALPFFRAALDKSQDSYSRRRRLVFLMGCAFDGEEWALAKESAQALLEFPGAKANELQLAHEILARLPSTGGG